jgi:hypothetical protein
MEFLLCYQKGPFTKLTSEQWTALVSIALEAERFIEADGHPFL